MHTEKNTLKQANPPEIKAAMLIIGDEILSGRTQDKNLAWLSDYLGKLGIQMAEVRVVPDVHEKIVSAVNELRRAYDYVFTTGGIGPTPDDITAEAIAAAFDLPYQFHPDAKKILEHFYGDQINEARLRMAKMPRGAKLIDNPVSHAPGFYVENVFVMAGVPKIMQAMAMNLDGVLARGAVRHQISFTTPLREGVISETLAAAMKEFPDVSFGSYPRFLDGGGTEVTLVLRGYDETALQTAQKWVLEKFSAL
ncbi:MAG TPA: molybdopterin-binding protein [Alphaproteobacteria bacterium]|nr:competence/damage-inducible protein A [Rhodospirillaceae bacterium]HRJ12014.1 molybdopterin-binding protein [Alphaproteobacteria bacterium]